MSVIITKNGKQTRYEDADDVVPQEESGKYDLMKDGKKVGEVIGPIDGWMQEGPPVPPIII